MRKIFFSFLLLPAVSAFSQLKIDSAVFFIGAGATVTVQGDVTSNVDILGTGLLLLKGSALQHIDMGGNTIPNLELDNSTNATLINSNTRIGNSLVFTNGKLQLANLDLRIASAATMSGQNGSRFVQTNGTGKLCKQLSGDVSNLELPVGENNNYRPAYLTVAGASYASAQFGVRVLGTADPSKPPMIASFLKIAWPVAASGISGGTVFLSGQYIDPADVQGTETNLRGYFNDGVNWSSAGETHDFAANKLGAPVTGASGVVSGMNKFLAVGARAYLQGAYNATTGLMTDNLTTLPFGPASSAANFPQDDPYRQSPYTAQFTHVNNSIIENIPSSSVIAPQVPVGNSIVDWVFLELRNLNASPGNTVLQTRSALIQRDGDIVDVDGLSPVTFNNLADGTYVLSVRHRNHLGLSLDPTNAVAQKNFTETKSLAWNNGRVADLRISTDAQLFGTASAFTTAAHPSLGTVNLLWGGDVSGNGFVRYQGSNGPTGPNDRVVLLQNLGGVESTVLTGYYRGDLNFNKIMRYQGSNGPTGPNDRVVLLQILGNVESTIRTQALPN